MCHKSRRGYYFREEMGLGREECVLDVVVVPRTAKNNDIDV